jgi:hypothetical protein
MRLGTHLSRRTSSTWKLVQETFGSGIAGFYDRNPIVEMRIL